MINTKSNPFLAECRVSPISLKDARKITVAKHYMGTWPQGAKVAFGLFKKSKCVGVMVAGYAPTTERKVAKWCRKIQKSQYIELQRTWISDEMGHNTESWMMARVMRLFKKSGVWLVMTHSGGCKDDVGFIFQASGWLYFGADPCNDFYETERGEYKNLVSAMRFGRVSKDILKRGQQAIGEHLFGAGKIVNARRHLYIYPINRGLRQRLKKQTLPFPKNPAIYRLDQKWHPANGVVSTGLKPAKVSDSIPDNSAIL
jgi:hypothetical protein